MHRKAVESQYMGKCSVYEYKKMKDEETKLSKLKDVLVYEAVPCRLSFSNAPYAVGDGTVVRKQQTVKLFLAPEIIIKAGSKIVVKQNNIEQVYKRSGESVVYASHQEVNLELFTDKS